MLPLDLHVLSLPLAFILSQDQTLLCISYFSRLSFQALGINVLLCLYFSSQPFQTTIDVEIVGVEPTTLCLQSRCSSQLSYTPRYSFLSARSSVGLLIVGQSFTEVNSLTTGQEKTKEL